MQISELLPDLLSETFLQPLEQRCSPEAAGPVREPHLHTHKKQAEQKPGEASGSEHQRDPAPQAALHRLSLPLLKPAGGSLSVAWLTKGVCAAQPYGSTLPEGLSSRQRPDSVH